MRDKIGRNDPCPCGSGKKFKHCHMRQDVPLSAAPPPHEHEGGAERALAWLVERHRKAFKAAFDDLLDDVLPEEQAQAPLNLPENVAESLQINLTEWLLAEGDIQVKGSWRDISEYLLNDAGPRLAEAQRGWLAQLASRPLRLYAVTGVQPGVGLTLCDALDNGAVPLEVRERAGSQGAKPGMLIGCRVMAVDDHLELSGALYPFAPLHEAGVRAAVRAEEEATSHPDDRPYMMGLAIVRAWVHQFLAAPPLPQMIDAATGQPLLLVTDHYRVVDADTLRQAMERRDDVAGDAQGGWRRESEDERGLVRSSAAINPGKERDRIEVFYRTQRLADEGRIWFESVARDAVLFLTREISDPKSVLSKTNSGATRSPPATGLPPEVVADAIKQVLLRSYANWADEPIPALDGKTPRQAIRTAAGLERVKGLLRSYEAGEAEMAARENRRQISYQFLWDALGIER
jgi:hypothetical protein